MVRKIAGASTLIAGLVVMGPAQAQGFSPSGVGGIAAVRGTTASSGYGGGEVDGGAVGEPVANVRRSPPDDLLRLAPTDIDVLSRDGGAGAIHDR